MLETWGCRYTLHRGNIHTENHKGSMDVVSEKGKGTTFIIRLPYG